MAASEQLAKRKGKECEKLRENRGVVRQDEQVFALTLIYHTEKCHFATSILARYFNFLTPLQKGVTQFVFYINTWQILLFMLFQISTAKWCWNNIFAYLHHLVLIS